VGHWGGVAARGMGRGLAWPRRHVGRAGDASVRAGGRGGMGGVAGGLAPRVGGGRGKPRGRTANLCNINVTLFALTYVNYLCL